MEFAVIAAGEGSRLKQGGIASSKPVAKLNGVPLLQRLFQFFLRNRAERILVIINESAPDVEAFLAELHLPVELMLVKQTTPSSLHSFAALLPHVKGEKLCLTTVDTVFEEEAFSQYISAFEQSQSWDALMAVTPFVDDESPLYVRINEALRITAFDDGPSAEARFVSGGIYCFREPVFPLVQKAVATGASRMRNFQRMLLAEDLHVQAFPFQKIIDIDRKEDLQQAEEWLSKKDGNIRSDE